MIAGYNAVLEIKRLTLSSPEYVYAYLESHANEDVPPGFLEALYQRNNDLINLGLARYSNDLDVLRKLFRTPSLQEKEALRCAVLANPKCDFALSVPLEKEELQAVLEQGTEIEIQASVSNKALKGTDLAYILSRTGWAQTLSDDRWSFCVFLALSGNPNLKKQFRSHFAVGYSSGWEHYEHDKALEAAWKVLESAPPSEIWALRLGRVFGAGEITPHHQCNDAFFRRVSRAGNLTTHNWKNPSVS